MRHENHSECHGRYSVWRATLKSQACLAWGARLSDVRWRAAVLVGPLLFSNWVSGCALVESSSKRSPPQNTVASPGLLGQTPFAHSAENTKSAAPSALPTTPALVNLPWMVRLSEDDPKVHDMATLPLGAAERRPVIVAVHGAGDRPDWACGGWRIGVESFAFVTCPMGLSMGGSRYGWGSTRDIAHGVERALTALQQRFPDYVGQGPMIYAGFSQGATLAAPFLIENAQRFPLVVLAEGGYGYIGDQGFSKAFRAAGGQRVMLLCGTASCLATANRAKGVLERAELEVIVSGDPSAGHNLNTAMQNALRRDWSRLVEGYAGWDTYPAHRWRE
jgi:predicted esterase